MTQLAVIQEPTSSTTTRLTPEALGLAYALSSALFLLAAFGLALWIRWQLAWPEGAVPGLLAAFGDQRAPGGRMLPELYNQLGAVHGTMMVFFGVVPLSLSGLGLWLVPRKLGSAGLAFPRTLVAGFLCHVAGGVLLLASLWAPGGAAQAGWTSYPPLSFLGGDGQSWWLVALLLAAVAALTVSVSLLVTAVQRRAKGLAAADVPFSVWALGVGAFLELLALPPFALGVLLQLSDRHLGTAFFLPADLVVGGQVLEQGAASGSPILWQHLFWFLAHPEVYVLILPGLAIVAEVYQVHARSRLWGRRVAIGSLLFLGVVSFLVWAHHMFLTGMGPELAAFFQVTTMLVSVPSVVIGTSLLLTLWGGEIRFTPPMLFALAFLPLFALGGLSGLPLGMAASDVHLHDTTYVVGHFHFLVGTGTLFALFAGVYHWLPRWCGRRPSRLLAQLHFWPTLLGMSGVFAHMMIQGLGGMPRRLYDGGAAFARLADLLPLHDAATQSALLLAVAQVPFLLNLAWTPLRGEAATNPWDAGGREWEETADDAAVPEKAGEPREHEPTPFTDAELGRWLWGAAGAMFLAALASSWVFVRFMGPGGAG